MCIECLSCVRFYIHYLTLPMLLMGEKLLISMLTSEEGNFTPLRYSCLENPMDGGAWWAAVCGVAKSRTRLSDFIFTFHFHALEKEMSPHSSVLTWRIPGTAEPGGLPSMGSHRVGHDWSDLAAAAVAWYSYSIFWFFKWHLPIILVTLIAYLFVYFFIYRTVGHCY